MGSSFCRHALLLQLLPRPQIVLEELLREAFPYQNPSICVIYNLKSDISR